MNNTYEDTHLMIEYPIVREVEIMVHIKPH